MSLSPRQIKIIRITFTWIPDHDRLAGRFYARLFAINPGTRPMFRRDMSLQRTKLIDMLAHIIDHLDDLPQITPEIEALGKRHLDYGVTAADWDSVGVALLWALEYALGPAFTDEVRTSWEAAYALIAKIAIEATYGEQSQRCCAGTTAQKL